ncbi:LOW QUALITY PROTEIN: E3 ubiquitin-protein ligase BRE1B [Harpia harpyja]|uniref:LOW QUALITY PROTEIN: E3 ubiquitin-protein ligase BRE1B n=1 Tax=Harpia harpyja TaxID=202280 RepID=UPI0022B200E5|nr:LOW QUALITY PROTEIN: E3 ubiquitin-protein ligase BRE1B [Harpia harpyja]
MGAGGGSHGVSVGPRGSPDLSRTRAAFGGGVAPLRPPRPRPPPALLSWLVAAEEEGTAFPLRSPHPSDPYRFAIDSLTPLLPLVTPITPPLPLITLLPPPRPMIPPPPITHPSHHHHPPQARPCQGRGAKRGASDGGERGPPREETPREEQPPTTLIEPLRLGGISSTEEMDLKVLQFKNKKLAERLEQRQACEDELRERIEKLEKRQATDDATLLLVNRFWGQLDAEVQALLRRYEGEGGTPPAPPGDPPEPRPEGPEPPQPPSARPKGSDRRAEPWGGPGVPPPPPPPTAPPPGGMGGAPGGAGGRFRGGVEPQRPRGGGAAPAPPPRLRPRRRRPFGGGAGGGHRRAHELGARLAARPELAEAGRALLRELLREHRRLQDLTLQLQEKHHRVSLELAELQDKATSAETKVLEMGTTVEGLQWDSAKLRKREGRLDRHLAEALEQLTSGSYGSGSSGGFQGGQITLSMQKFEMLNAELEGNQELANSRMAELEKLQQELQQAVRGHERLKVALRSLPEEAVKETLEYKVLESQFSLLYHESLQVKTQLDEARALLLATKNSHLRHIEHMESDELGVQKRLRTEVIQLEDTLAQVRKEYEMLRIEFEQNLAANEQAGPINREMRHLISSLQNHNHQLKGDVQRYKRKLREVQAEINKLRLQASGAPPPQGSAPPPPPPPTAATAAPPEETTTARWQWGGGQAPPPSRKKRAGPHQAPPPLSPSGRQPAHPPRPKRPPHDDCLKRRSLPLPSPPLPPHRPPPLPRPPRRSPPPPRAKDPPPAPPRPGASRGGPERERERLRERERPKGPPDEPKKKDSEVLKQLRAELKKAQESQKEMKLLLDMYKSAPKEQRDKVQLMAAERKSKAEAEELRGRARELEERERRESKKLADEEALRRLRQAEEQIEHLQRKLAATKQEEEALLSEMDVTGQAFEDMQEQNLRLLQQLREKDDANFKLMSERIKANQIHKLLREEKDELAEQVLALKAQVDAQLLVVQKLEEKERGLQSSLAAVEKELALRSQALELNKRKAVEAAQLAEDLRAQGEHVQARLRELQACAAENRAAKDKESLSLKRAQEELSRLRRKLEKQRKVEVYADADQILQEEIKEYRARLTCPCCNARKKDAVLTKCFHVFCFECVKSRYDTRQRKCPKCNAAFGAHDFHRVYIS